MALWWVGNVLPMAVTALLPLVAFPVLGILSVKEAAAPFAHPLNFLMLGGFLMAVAMERVGLHRRLTALVLAPAMVRSSPRRVVMALMVTEQELVPEQPPPDQPLNVDSDAAVAVRVTCWPKPKLPESLLQLVPQLIPAGLLVTVPDPVPPFSTVRVRVCRVKLAVTVVLAFMVTVQELVPEQPPPDHPVNVDPTAGDAVNLTDVKWT